MNPLYGYIIFIYINHVFLSAAPCVQIREVELMLILLLVVRMN